MTRINIVPVECLTNKHLLAEYKEITRPFNKVINRIEKYGETDALKDCNIPSEYTLGAGHETFFFDKLMWLCVRYTKLYVELYGRGFKVDFERFNAIYSTLRDNLHTTKYWNNYTPTPEDMYLNMARLAKRSKLDNVLKELNLGEI